MGLGFICTARDLASAKMVQLERRFSSLDDRVSAGTACMSSAFRQLGVGLAVFTAGAALVAGSFALANTAGQFEQGIAAVGAVTRATTYQLRLLAMRPAEAGSGSDHRRPPPSSQEQHRSTARLRRRSSHPAKRCKPTSPPADLSKPTPRAPSPFSVSESTIRPERRRQSRCSCSPPPPAESNASGHDHRHRRRTPRTLALSCESPVDFSTGLPVNQPRAGTRGSKKWLRKRGSNPRPSE